MQFFTIIQHSNSSKQPLLTQPNLKTKHAHNLPLIPTKPQAQNVHYRHSTPQHTTNTTTSTTPPFPEPGRVKGTVGTTLSPPTTTPGAQNDHEHNTSPRKEKNLTTSTTQPLLEPGRVKGAIGKNSTTTTTTP